MGALLTALSYWNPWGAGLFERGTPRDALAPLSASRREVSLIQRSWRFMRQISGAAFTTTCESAG